MEDPQQLVIDLRSKMEEQQQLVIELQSKISASNYRSEIEVESKKCIYMVPKTLRDHNEHAYTPQVIYFGPYHHGKAHLKPMEKYKHLLLTEYLERANTTLDRVVEAFWPMVRDLMDAYDDLEEPWTDKERFLELMILDGCCLLLYIIRSPLWAKMLRRRYMDTEIWMDVRRLENQLPLLVLAILIEMGGHRVEDTDKFLAEFGVPRPERATVRGKGHHHLDIEMKQYTRVRQYFYDLKWNVRPAVELFQAGVSFKPSQTSCYNDISFSNGVLQLPAHYWTTDSEALLLNYIAYESVYGDTNLAITQYAFLMDNLIDTDKDVALLRKTGIIECTAGSDSEIASVFNRLTKGVPFPEMRHDSHGNVNKNLKEYCNKRRNKWRASFKQAYLANPWVFSSLVAAFVLLVLTILQTTYSILPYYHKS